VFCKNSAQFDSMIFGTSLLYQRHSRDFRHGLPQ
jgi:hypothetical protein